MAAPVLVTQILKFGNFELDTRAGELRKGGVKVRLRGQPLQVLTILLERPGDVVRREELRDQIWPANTFVDFDHGVHKAIARIREALGDSAESPRFIETLPRTGYRFIAPVEGVEAPRNFIRNGDKKADVVPIKPPSRPHAGLILLVAAACCLAGFALWRGWRYFYGNGAPTIRSIAVLPLQNFSADASQEYLADGMTEELITELSRIHGLKVVSHTSVMEYKGTRKHIPQIARELGVDGIVEGSVVRDGSQVRITVQLLDALNDRHIWSENYQREMHGILNLQREIGQSIAQQVRIQLTPQQMAGVGSGRAVNPEAYEAYLRGRSFITADFLTPQALKAAQIYFEQSIQKDPNFALGYVGLADCYVYLALFDELSPEQAYGPAQEALRKAMELDDSIGEAHATLALLHWRHDWNWAATEQEFNTAIALAPNFGCAHLLHSYYLSWRGRRDEAFAELAKSRELDPGYDFAATEAAAYYQFRDYKGLVEASQRELAANPNEWPGHDSLGVGYQGSGKQQEAIPEFEKAVEMSGGDQNSLASLAHAYSAIGKKDKALKILGDLEQKSRSSYVSPYVIATIYAGLGDTDKAFEFLEKSYQQRSWDLVWQLKSDLRLDTLRGDPRFGSLIRKVGLPQ